MEAMEVKHVWYKEMKQRLQEYENREEFYQHQCFEYEELDMWDSENEQTEPINYHKDITECSAPLTPEPEITDREVLFNYYQELLAQNKIRPREGSVISMGKHYTHTDNNSQLIAVETRNAESSLDTPSSSPAGEEQSDIENTSPKRSTSVKTVNKTLSDDSSQSESNGTSVDRDSDSPEAQQPTGAEQGSYPCTHCEKQFAYIGNLKRHIKMHHGEYRPYKCSLCVKRFWGSDSLQQHFKRVHSKDRPYACAHCEKKYSVCYDLQKHVRSVHGKDIDWEMSVPSKEFGVDDVGRDRKKVTGIKTVHLGQLQHKCKFCNRGFATFNGLGVHLKMHFRCKVCCKGFNTEESLKTHIEKAQHVIPAGQEYVL